MAFVSFVVFACAVAVSGYVFWATLIPALPRIVSLLRDGTDPVAATPVYAIVSEPRLRARLRTTRSVALPAWREAA